VRGPRGGYVLALVAAALVLVGSMVGVAAYTATNRGDVNATIAARPGPGGGMMGSGTSTAGGSYRYQSLTCSAPSNLPGSTVRVTLADMGMSRMMGGDAPLGARMMLRTSASSVPAGTVNFVAANMGWRTHELVILPLADGAQAGQRAPGADGTIDESGSLGEASASCGSGTGDGIASGTVGWTTMTLAPGRYEVVCNEANHYADGMYQELDVT
jgi:uncharacterized cupredoxin-like copper-binding protein